VAKLNDAKNVVNELEKKAKVQREKLSQKQSEADIALNEITRSMQGAGEQKIEMEDLKVKIEAENKILAKRKAEIEEELKEVQPIVDEAKRAVGQIKPEALSEIRSLRAPPDAVRDILEAVLRLMGTLDTSWTSIKKFKNHISILKIFLKLINQNLKKMFSFLGKRGVKEEIINFNPRTIGTENREAVEKLLKKNSESFDPEVSIKINFFNDIYG
jgi:dynein heavy chain 2